MGFGLLDISSDRVIVGLRRFIVWNRKMETEMVRRACLNGINTVLLLL